MTIKHSKLSPITVDYRANTVIPTRHVIYRKVKVIRSMPHIGIITLEGRKIVVTRKLQANNCYTAWEVYRVN